MEAITLKLNKNGYWYFVWQAGNGKIRMVSEAYETKRKGQSRVVAYNMAQAANMIVAKHKMSIFVHNGKRRREMWGHKEILAYMKQVEEKC